CMKTRSLLLACVIASCVASGAAQQNDAQPPHVPEKVMLENVLHNAPPAYPEEARTKQIQGLVIVSIAVDRNGSVTEAKLAEGDPVLGAAAVKAIEQWKFRPYLLNGEAMEVISSVTVNFRLKPPAPAESPVPPGTENVPPRIKVSSGVMEGKLVHKVDPSYPLEAKVGHIQGYVVLAAVISKDGNLVQLKVVEGDPILAA